MAIKRLLQEIKNLNFIWMSLRRLYSATHQWAVLAVHMHQCFSNEANLHIFFSELNMTMAPSDFAQSRRCIEISSRKNANFKFLWFSLQILRKFMQNCERENCFDYRRNVCSEKGCAPRLVGPFISFVALGGRANVFRLELHLITRERGLKISTKKINEVHKQSLRLFSPPLTNRWEN